ncbi:LytR/AlgR family response regulator transcription factor [Flavisolibacter nicotianae]|uniref:LytR/AlgR family response regulator transcription factor n=1 Tax=Flavisolibacter nicotianae TaxID=2364882 RepID=UPI000EB35FEE|nr:LytTR family DNA-binding domain-containing protein [Flavisolibacter nicotianae]
MNVLIVEDEALAVEKLRSTLRAVEAQAAVVGVTGSIRSSVEWLRTHPAPDMILMDIELSDGQSFEIFRQLQVRSPVIFTTSYDEYAIRAFKVNSVDYLLKPVEEEDLKAAMQKYRDVHQKQPALPAFDVNVLVKELQAQLKQPEYRERFLVKLGQRFVTIDTSEIAYFFVDGRLYYLVTADGKKYTIDYTLEELEQMLDPKFFFRAGRSYLVHLRSVVQIHSYFNGKLKLQLKPAVLGSDVVISKERTGEFKKWMGR